MNLSQEHIQKLEKISLRIQKSYNGVECDNFKGSCLNSVRQSLEYLCLFTCEVYDIKITRRTKKGDIVENDNPTLGDMAPLIEKHFKQNDVLWSKEVGMHIGSIWILGNLGSHAQKENLETDAEISKATIQNALNSVFIVTEWFYKHYEQECPIKQRDDKKISEDGQKVIDKSNQLYEKLALLQQKNEEETHKSDNTPPKDEDEFEDIYFDDLMEAIQLGQCVLFLGPNLSVDESGNNIHEKFYKKISRRNIIYNDKDGFFMPQAEKQIELKAMNFYANKFHEENTIAQNLLAKLAKIPFSLTVAVTPDNTMDRILDQYNIKHEFVSYSADIKHNVTEPTKEMPVVFNMLGNTADDGKYIFTNKQFYEYINQTQEVKIPFEIETKISNVAHYLFIGFDFNKWYNRLLLFVLNLYKEAEAYSFEANELDEIHQEYVNKEFNISFIDNEYEKFIDILLQYTENENQTRDLIKTFIENTTEDIVSLSKKENDSETLQKLDEIEEKINRIIENTKTQ